MNTSFKFLIPTIFISLGFLISCNDNITFSEEEESDENTSSIEYSKTSKFSQENVEPTGDPITDFPLDDPSYYRYSNVDYENYNKIENDINIEDLYMEIREIGEKIGKLEEEKNIHYSEFRKIVEFQKGILQEIINKKKIMRSKPVGSEAEKKAKKDFEDEKKFSDEKFEILKDKNDLLYNIVKSIREARSVKMDLQKKLAFFVKKERDKEEKERKERKEKERQERKERKEKERQERNKNKS
ncbi:hypothetical protein [Blattabacterium sp. (Blaberus giganteus)]|uniref:hypothetical protein n=1 Tax=Blattabacterium sp. (Blaberus giganteus) TaxID=1186051 RepID=UPI00025F6EBF|nr:hypothetical protein [Blattabacterium sp. (Blaberus giganteus)]AFJ90640.1 hypothetical protein BGIGA_189 [Blattabacterium sp. (Blaberus giganteus)]